MSRVGFAGEKNSKRSVGEQIHYPNSCNGLAYHNDSSYLLKPPGRNSPHTYYFHVVPSRPVRDLECTGCLA